MVDDIAKNMPKGDVSMTRREKRTLAKEQRRENRAKTERMGSWRKWGVWLLVLAILVWGGKKFVNFFNTPVEIATSTVEILDGEWIKGEASASATLVEYGDFQCPACGNYYPLIKQLEEKYPEDLRVVYRHFPLISIHPNAMPAALAAEAAGAQGMFWEMHDILYEKQTEWSGSKDAVLMFETYAKELGLDLDKFKLDMTSSEIKDAVNADIVSANAVGVNATPTFYLNGTKLQNPAGLEPFSSLIEAEIK